MKAKKLCQRDFREKRKKIMRDCHYYIDEDGDNEKRVRDEEKRLKAKAEMRKDAEENFDTDTMYKVMNDNNRFVRNRAVEEAEKEKKKTEKTQRLIQEIFDIVVMWESGEFTEKDLKEMAYKFVTTNCKID